MIALFLLTILNICQCSIVNQSTLNNIQVPMGNYTQFRISGFGMGDDALEDDLAKVSVLMNFEGTKANQPNSKSNQYGRKISFDILVFDKNKDYLCYIEAIALMYEENVLKTCDFVKDNNIVSRQKFSYSDNAQQFLSQEKRASEILVIIDNTEWPEALSYPPGVWKSPKPYSEEISKTVFLTVRLSTYFTSTTTH